MEYLDVASRRGPGIDRAQNFRDHLADWGLRRTLYWYVMCRAARLGFQIAYVRVGADRLIGELEVQKDPPGYETRVVDVEELVPFVGKDTDLTMDFLERAKANGDECTANFHGDQLVGYGFVARGLAKVTDQVDVVVPIGFRYAYRGWTHPKHRRKNLSRVRGYVRRKVRRYPHAERGIDYIATHNYPSLMTGYRHPNERPIRMGFVGYFTWFGRQIPFSSRKAKWIGLRFVRRGDTKPFRYVP